VHRAFVVVEMDQIDHRGKGLDLVVGRPMAHAPAITDINQRPQV